MRTTWANYRPVWILTITRTNAWLKLPQTIRISDPRINNTLRCAAPANLYVTLPARQIP